MTIKETFNNMVSALEAEATDNWLTAANISDMDFDVNEDGADGLDFTIVNNDDTFLAKVGINYRSDKNIIYGWANTQHGSRHRIQLANPYTEQDFKSKIICLVECILDNEY